MKRALCVLLFAALAGCVDEGVRAVRPVLVTVPETVDFETVPVLNQKTLEIDVTNVGRAKLTVSNLALAKDDGIFRLMTRPEEVESGETEKLVVVFTPQAEQPYEDTLTFETNDQEHPTVTVKLVGVGSTRAIVEVSPAMLDFGRVAECGSTVLLLAIQSKGTADLVINDIGFADGSSPAFTFVGSTRTPAVVKTVDANGLPGEIQLTVRVTVPAGSEGTLTGGIRLSTTDPDRREVIVPITATVNKAPLAVIAPLGNGAPGQLLTLDASGSSDPDGDVPLTYRWSLRSKPLASMTTIAMPDEVTTSMTLDATVPGAYEVQLDVTDSTGAKSCQPARTTVVASPAQKLLIEMFWDNSGTDVDLHVLRTKDSPLFTAPDDCHYQNRTPDWGTAGDPTDDPEFVRDALTGYGPEVFGYVNPVDSTYRVVAVLQNTLLSPTPASKVTVRVYLFGVLKSETYRTLTTMNEIWAVADVTWPSGDVTVLP